MNELIYQEDILPYLTVRARVKYVLFQLALFYTIVIHITSATVVGLKPKFGSVQ